MVCMAKRQTGEEMMSEARYWIGEHPREWNLIVNEVNRRMATGRKFSLRNICDNVCWEQKVKVRHALTAPFHRILSQRIEGFENLCDRAKSKCDKEMPATDAAVTGASK